MAGTNLIDLLLLPIRVHEIELPVAMLVLPGMAAFLTVGCLVVHVTAEEIDLEEFAFVLLVLAVAGLACPRLLERLVDLVLFVSTTRLLLLVLMGFEEDVSVFFFLTVFFSFFFCAGGNIKPRSLPNLAEFFILCWSSS